MDKFNDLILLQFQKIPLSDINYVSSYIASEVLSEPETSLILRFLEFRFPHVCVAAPKISAKNLEMTHYQISENGVFEKNTFGIEEPTSGNLVSSESFDLVLVPLLAFDVHGYRVGHGKGYYDRFLSECKDGVVKVGLSFFDPVAAIEDINEYDIPLDYCCTPEGLYNW